MEDLNRTFLKLSNQVPYYVWNLMVILAAIILGFIIKKIIFKAIKHYKAIEEFSIFKSAITNIGKPLSFFLPLFIFNILIPLLKVNLPFLRFVNKTVEICFVVVFAYLLISLIRVLQDFIIHSYSLKKDDNLKERKIITQLQFLRKILVSLIVILAIAAILFSFEGMRKIGAGLLTGVGVGGIIIGFAAQKSLGNLLAGFQIAFTQPIRMDDVLVVEGEWGRVEEITLTYVVVAIWDQRRLILPINYFIEKPFQNWTRTSSEILGTIFLYTDYTVPIDKLREEFERLLNLSPLWDRRAQVLQVTDIKTETIEIRALMSASNSSNAFDLRCYIRENLIHFIQANYPDSLPKTRAVLNQS